MLDVQYSSIIDWIIDGSSADYGHFANIVGQNVADTVSDALARYEYYVLSFGLGQDETGYSCDFTPRRHHANARNYQVGSRESSTMEGAVVAALKAWTASIE